MARPFRPQFWRFRGVFPNFVSVYCAKSAQNARTDRKISVFPSIRAYFASIHTQFGLLRRLRGSGGRPCGLSPPRAPPCRLLFRRAAPRACGVVAVEGVSSRPTNKGRCAPSPDRACRAFQRPANPSPRHDITRPTQQNVQVILLRLVKELQSARKIAGCYSVISDTGYFGSIPLFLY